MKRAPWSGRIPSDEADARRRIVGAALACVRRQGIEGTRVAEIAAEAGVSRPTLYAYFTSREEIIEQAVVEAGRRFVDDVVVRALRFDSPAERLVETTLFCVQRIRGDPVLAARFGGADLRRRPLDTDELTLARACLRAVGDLESELESRIDEMAEVVARVLSSLVVRDPPRPRTAMEERAFLLHWYPAAIGIEQVETR
ncbi:MAG: TetR/AcrR family transcriptional regulator [Acidimicrobiales bacterium]